METIDYRTDEKNMLDVVCPESEQAQYAGSDYDKLVAFLAEHKPEIMSQMAVDSIEDDECPGCDTKHYLIGLQAFMDLDNDRFMDLMNYVARNKDFILSQLDYEVRYAEVPTLNVTDLNEILAKIHDQNHENGYRWAAKMQNEINALCKEWSMDYLYGKSRWNINRSSN